MWKWLTVAACVITTGAALADDAFAESFTLKCETDTGIPHGSDLVIDLDKRELRWAKILYRITHITDDYITASILNQHNDVGGEIWVLNRSSGEYWRAGVGMFCTDNDCTSQKMGTGTYEGICRKKIF